MQLPEIQYNAQEGRTTPRSLRSLRGCPTTRIKKTTYERVKEARRKNWEWQKRKDERKSFNDQQGTAATLKPTAPRVPVPLNDKEKKELGL